MSNDTAETLPMLPCPAWCDLPADHPYEGISRDGGDVRYHTHDAADGGSWSIVVECDETLNEDGSLHRGAPRLVLYTDNDSVELDHWEAGILATELDDARLDFKRITGEIE